MSVFCVGVIDFVCECNMWEKCFLRFSVCQCHQKSREKSGFFEAFSLTKDGMAFELVPYLLLVCKCCETV